MELYDNTWMKAIASATSTFTNISKPHLTQFSESLNARTQFKTSIFCLGSLSTPFWFWLQHWQVQLQHSLTHPDNITQQHLEQYGRLRGNHRRRRPPIGIGFGFVFVSCVRAIGRCEAVSACESAMFPNAGAQIFVRCLAAALQHPLVSFRVCSNAFFVFLFFWGWWWWWSHRSLVYAYFYFSFSMLCA